ncbi:MAG: hypothetical protein MUF75_06925 [Bacteroidia bacterium]|jgi:hypothetical protein|nr:hypothetical protein [Bacteroidia bacterium]
MKNIACLLLMVLSTGVTAQKASKAKSLKLLYTLPEGWNAMEFGNPQSKAWEEGAKESVNQQICNCAGISFSKSHKDGRMNVVVYPSTASGLDSTKRNFVGSLQFQDVEKYDNIRNNGVSFKRKKSNFIDSKTKNKSFEVYRFFAKVDDHYYIIYAWQENMQILTSTNQKMLFDMVNAIQMF